MFGGSEAFIEGMSRMLHHRDIFLMSANRIAADLLVSFNPTSSGQVSLVIYEWSDVQYLGVDTPENSVGGISRPVRGLRSLRKAWIRS